MSSKSQWLSILMSVGLGALKASPLAAIAEPIAIAIGDAQGIPGANGPAKLQHVLSIAKQAAIAAKAEGVNIDPSLVEEAGTKAISTAVDVTNIVVQAHAPTHAPVPVV